jgi:hypothetical protein
VNVQDPTGGRKKSRSRSRSRRGWGRRGRHGACADVWGPGGSESGRVERDPRGSDPGVGRGGRAVTEWRRIKGASC